MIRWPGKNTWLAVAGRSDRAAAAGGDRLRRLEALAVTAAEDVVGDPQLIATHFGWPALRRDRHRSLSRPSRSRPPVRRVEDLRFLAGAGRFVDDIAAPGAAYLHVLRSPHAAARIAAIDTAAASVMPGVLLVLAEADLDIPARLRCVTPRHRGTARRWCSRPGGCCRRKPCGMSAMRWPRSGQRHRPRRRTPPSGSRSPTSRGRRHRAGRGGAARRAGGLARARAGQRVLPFLHGRRRRGGCRLRPGGACGRARLPDQPRLRPIRWSRATRWRCTTRSRTATRSIPARSCRIDAKRDRGIRARHPVQQAAHRIPPMSAAASG